MLRSDDTVYRGVSTALILSRGAAVAGTVAAPALAATSASLAAGAVGGGAAAAAGAGAAAGVGATAGGAGAGFLGIGPVGWAIIAVAIIGSFLLRGKKRTPPPEAKGLTFAQPTAGFAPWLKVYGQRWFAPPMLSQWPIPTQFDRPTIGKDTLLVRLFHTGGGQVHGADLRVRIGNQQLFDVITPDSPLAQRELNPKYPGSRKVWTFPNKGVDPKDVVIYFDGTAMFYGDIEAGHAPDGAPSTTVAPKNCAPVAFTSSQGVGALATSENVDGLIPFGDTRIGCFLPTGGFVDEKSVSVTIQFKENTYYRLPSSNATPAGFLSKSFGGSYQFAKQAKLAPSDWALGITQNGRQYLWARLEISNRTPPQFVSQGLVTGFTVSYSVRPASSKGGGMTVDVRTDGAGNSVAVFSEDVPASVSQVTAVYKTSIEAGDNFRYVLTAGTSSQAPVASDADFAAAAGTSSRRVVQVGLELTQGTPCSFSSTADVDDILIGIQAGPRGFFRLNSDGNPSATSRKLAISYKHSTANDQGANGNDPATGWVVLQAPWNGADRFEIKDKFTGSGTWYFSLANLVEYLKTSKPATGAVLPARKYDVKIVASDPANAQPGTEIVNEDREFSTVYFQTATEIRRLGLVLPNQSTLSVAYGDGMDQSAVLETRFAGSIVAQPSSASATVDSTTGLPVPMTAGYSRNPVWAACDLITDPLCGAGRHFGWDDIDIESAYDAAAWCAETMTLRDGSTQVRSYCDFVIGEDGERLSLGDQLARLLAGSGVFCFWSGTWKFVVDEDDAVATDPNTSADFEIVEEDDCPAGGCELEYASAEELPTELVVEFRDGDNGDLRSTETIQAPDPQPEPRVTERVEFPAVSRRTQVRHFGGILLRQMRAARRRLKVPSTVGRGLRLHMLEPGDVVLFTSARLGLTELKCRVMQTGWTQDMRLVLELVEHDPAVYDDGFAGPNSGVMPGSRVASDSLEPEKLDVRRVSSAVLTVGGAA